MLLITPILQYALYLKITVKHFLGFAVNTMHMFVSDTMQSTFYCKFLRNVSWIQNYPSSRWRKCIKADCFIHLYLQKHQKQTQNCRVTFDLALLHERCSIMMQESVPEERRLHWMQQRCWAPAVFLLTLRPRPGWAEGQSEAPQTQSLQLSFPSVGRPPDRPYTRSQLVHVWRVWTGPQSEPWGGRYLPRCTVAGRRGQSTSSSCCSTVEGENTQHQT